MKIAEMDALRDELTKFPVYVTLRDEVVDLKKRADRLTAVRRKIEELVARGHLLKRALPGAKTLLASLAELRIGTDLDEQGLRVIESAAEARAKELAAAWSSHVQSRFAVARALPAALGRLTGFQGVARQLEAVSGEVSALAAHLPADESRLQRFSDLEGRLEIAIAGLAKGSAGTETGVAAAVASFLSHAASEEGAALSALTPAVRQWIDAQGIGSSVGVWLR